MKDNDFGLLFAHYGEEREVDATDEEKQLFGIVCDMAKEHGCEQITLVRKSDNYVTAAIGDYDIARMKYTDRAKWITFPYAEAKAVKHYIQDPNDIKEFDDLLIKAIEQIKKWGA